MSGFVQSGRFTPPAWIPTNIAGCLAWWDVSDASTITYSSGSNVSKIVDKSGHGAGSDKVSSGAGCPPRTGSQNGLSTLVFDGVNHFLGISGGNTLMSGGPRSVFAVVKRVSGAFSSIETGNGTAITIYFGTAGTVLVDKASVVNLFNAGAVNATGYHVISATVEATTTSVWCDGALIGTTTYGSTSFGGAGGAGWGASPTGTSKVAVEHGEGIIYNTALSTTNRQLVEEYLRAKWATPFHPLSIAGCQVWLPADQISGYADNADITSTVEKSSNGHTLSGISPYQKYITSGINGLPSISAPANGTASLRSSFTEVASPFTLVYTFDVSSVSGTRVLSDAYDTSGNPAGLWMVGTTFNMGGSATISAANAVPTAGVTHTVVAVFNGASSKFYLNGGAAAATGNTGTAGLSGIQIGQSRFTGSALTGRIGEVIAYNTALSLTDINNLGGYLTRWGTTWTVAT